MKTFTISNVTYTVPSYSATVQDEIVTFTLEEGTYAGVAFQIQNLAVSDTDDNVLTYDLYVSENANASLIKPIVDNVIVDILYEQLNKTVTS